MAQVPFVDEHSSILVHQGKSWRRDVPGEHAEEIFKKIAPEEKEDNSHEVDYAHRGMDWAMLDEVTRSWKEKTEELIARDMLAHRKRAKGRRRTKRTR